MQTKIFMQSKNIGCITTPYMTGSFKNHVLHVVIADLDQALKGQIFY
jgi:hypothetical protein